MTKQDLLNVGWKYLLVLLGFYAVYSHSNSCGHGAAFSFQPMDSDHMMMFKADELHEMDGESKRIEVKKEINADGDTTRTVTINGEPADISDLGEDEMHWIEKGESGEKHKTVSIKKMGGSLEDENVFIIKGSTDGKIMKKRIVKKVKD